MFRVVDPNKEANRSPIEQESILPGTPVKKIGFVEDLIQQLHALLRTPILKLDKIEALLDQGVEIAALGEDGNSALHVAVEIVRDREDTESLMDLLLRDDETAISTQNRLGLTAKESSIGTNFYAMQILSRYE